MTNYSAPLKVRLKTYFIFGALSLLIALCLISISVFWDIPDDKNMKGFSNIIIHSLNSDIRLLLGINNMKVPNHGYGFSFAKNIMIICFCIILYFMFFSKQKLKILFQIILILITYSANEYRQYRKVHDGGLYTDANILNEKNFSLAQNLISEKINTQDEMNNFATGSRSLMNLSDWRFQQTGLNYLLAQYYYIKNDPKNCYNSLSRIDEDFWLPSNFEQWRIYMMLTWLKNNNFEINSLKRVMSRGVIFLPPDYKIVLQPFVIGLGVLLSLSSIISILMVIILLRRIRRMDTIALEFTSRKIY